MDTSEYKDIFLAEAQEYLQGLNTALLDLEHQPDNQEILQEMFRAAHSLKGMSATMGYQLLANLTHQMENVLDLLRKELLQVDRSVANLLFESLDLLEALLDSLDSPEAGSGQVDALVAKLCSLCEADLAEDVPTQEDPALHAVQLDEFEKELVRSATNGEQARHIEVVLDASCLLKSVRAYMVFKSLEQFGHLIKSVPSAQELEEEQFEDRFDVILLTKASDQSIYDELTQIAEIAKVTIQNLADDGPGAPPLSSEQGEQVTAEVAEVRENNGEQKKVRRATEKTIRVETEKLDELINLVGELVINRTRVVELSKSDTMSDMVNSVEQLDRITTDLQSAIMKLRMVPIKQVFDRFPRMIRDLSQEKGKNVNLEIRGEETELDRSIVNQIGDPLVHLLRNSVDHGIESPEQRLALGKAEQGTILLEARHEGSFVLISVSDDGRGINADVVREKAVQKGILSSVEAQRLSDEDAARLIFKNGFSTAEQVTDISGRGVGMDAVKTVIESMNGNVDIKTESGVGTTFYVRLPLTLAIIKALLVELSGDTYAIPIESIRENLYVLPEDIKTIQGEKVINLRNEVLPLIQLEEALGMAVRQSDEELSVVVVEAGGRKAGLVVDTLLGQQEIVIKSLSKLVEGIPGIAGATVLGNGKVALILDVSNLI